MRRASFERKTSETNIKVTVSLDGTGQSIINLPNKFLSHMLTSLATHSLIDIKVEGKGDLTHHIVEDTALTLGEAISRALGDQKGIHRFGYASIPMDESLAQVSLDLSGRPYSVIDLKIKDGMVEDCPAMDLSHFFVSLAIGMMATLHVTVLYGEDDHHKTEAAFKALAISLRRAVEEDPRRQGVPSSKGVIS